MTACRSPLGEQSSRRGFARQDKRRGKTGCHLCRQRMHNPRRSSRWRPAGETMPLILPRVDCRRTQKVSDGSQPPMTFDLSLSESAGSRSLHRSYWASSFSSPIHREPTNQPGDSWIAQSTWGYARLNSYVHDHLAAAHASILRMISPWTSVSRKSRP